jgi:ketosteroid isomerase-like protein
MEQPLAKKTTFPTPQDAEAAFYEALEAADLEAMMETWAEDEDIVCVHPGGPRLSGYDQVRASWAQLFGSGQKLKVHLTNQVVLSGMMLSIHSVHENILVPGETRPRPPVAATNVYLRTGSGWRMLLHHASPVPQAPQRQSDSPKILH